MKRKRITCKRCGKRRLPWYIIIGGNGVSFNRGIITNYFRYHINMYPFGNICFGCVKEFYLKIFDFIKELEGLE